MTIDNSTPRDARKPNKTGVGEALGMPRAIHAGILTVSDIALPCVVLDDGRRVFAVQGIHKAFHMTTGAASLRRVSLANDFPLPSALSKPNAQIIYPEAARDAMASVFYIARNHRQGHGIEADGLAALCDVWLMARDHQENYGYGLNAFERPYVEVAQRLEDAFGQVGVFAQIDEATGYGVFAARRDLESLLERTLDEDLLEWTKSFPDTFFRELFRLRKWDYSPLRVSRPEAVGGVVQDIVYDTLDPAIVDDLRRKPPKVRSKRASLHLATPIDDIGHPRLRERVEAVTALMRASTNWPRFQRLLHRAFPGPVDDGPLE